MPALQSSQVVDCPGRYLRVFASVGMGCVWGLPSRRSGLKAGGVGGMVRTHAVYTYVCTRHTTDAFSTLLDKVSDQNRRQVNQGRGILGPLVKQLTVYYIGSSFDMQIPSIGASLSEPDINGLSGAGCYGVWYVRQSYANFGLQGSGDQI